MKLFKLLTLSCLVSSSLLEAAPVCVKPVQFFVKGGFSTNKSKIHAIPNAERLLRAVSSLELGTPITDKDNNTVTVTLSSKDGVNYTGTLPDAVVNSMVKTANMEITHDTTLAPAYLHKIQATSANTDGYQPIPATGTSIVKHSAQPSDQADNKVRVYADSTSTLSQHTYEKGILTIPINNKVTAKTTKGDLAGNSTAPDYFIYDGTEDETDDMKAKDIFATVVNDKNTLKINIDPTLQFKVPQKLFTVPAYNDVPKNYSASNWGGNGIVEAGMQFNAPYGGFLSFAIGGSFPFGKELTLKPGVDPDTDGKTDVDDFVEGTMKANAALTMALAAAVNLTEKFALGLEWRYTMAKYSASIALKRLPVLGKISKDYKLNTHSIGPKIMFNFTKNMGLELGVSFVSGGKLDVANSNKKDNSNTSNDESYFSMVTKPSVGINASFVVKF